MQLLVDKVLLQLFRLHHQSSAHKGAIQFFHISKSGGTNLCMAAEGNGCATESFDERRNCLIREFSDEPRWAAFTGHKYVQYSMHESTSTPWFVNYASARRVDPDCAARAAYLKQVRGVQALLGEVGLWASVPQCLRTWGTWCRGVACDSLSH